MDEQNENKSPEQSGAGKEGEEKKSSCCCSAWADKCCLSSVDWKDIFEKAKEVLMAPKEFWAKYKDTQFEIIDLYKKYLLVVAAISPIVWFLKLALFGPFPVIGGLVYAIMIYVVNLAGLYGSAVILELLAPHFGGTVTRENAMKVVAFSYLPAGLSAIFALFGVLVIVPIVVGLYALYIIYLGVVELKMASEQQKEAYTLVGIVGTILLFAVLHAVAGIVQPKIGPRDFMPTVNFNLGKGGVPELPSTGK